MGIKCVTILSGGLDSSVLAYYLKRKGYEQHFISFDYGQRHSRELYFAAMCANTLKCKHSVINLPLGDLLVGSSLTDDSVAVPHGHYEAESMAQTVVPGRNSIMLSIAAGIACAERAWVIACGVHAGDHAVYSDCRLDFIQALEKALKLGNDPIFRIDVPFIRISKAEIVRIGTQLQVPFQLTHTCYEGKEVACGRCGTDVERLSAFDEAGVVDPLEYKDREFWKEAIKNFKKGN